MIDKIMMLPQITISDMQYQLMKKSILKKNKKNKEMLELENNQHKINKNLIVTSPFYKKINQPHHIHHDRCTCAHHKGTVNRRSLENSTSQAYMKMDNKNEHLYNQLRHITEHCQSNQHLSFNHQLNLKDKFSTLKLLKPIDINQLKNQMKTNRKLHDQNMQPISYNHQSVELQRFSRFTHVKKGKIQQLNKAKINLLPLQSDIKCKVDDINESFLSVLNQRMENARYKDTYLKTLFKFIKMKRKTDDCYAKNSQGYLQNSLNLILNHYSIDKLLQGKNLTPLDLAKIGYFMNHSQKEKIEEVLEDLSKIVCEMEEHIKKINLNRQRIEEQKRKNMIKQEMFTQLNSRRDQNDLQKYTKGQTSWRNSHNSHNKKGQDNSSNAIEESCDYDRSSPKRTPKISTAKRLSKLKNSYSFQFSSKNAIQNKSFQSSEKNISEKKSQNTVNFLNYSGQTALQTVYQQSKITNVQEEELNERKKSTATKKLKKLKTKIFKPFKKQQEQSIKDIYKDIKFQQYFTKQEFKTFLKQYQNISKSKNENEIMIMLLKYSKINNNFQNNNKIIKFIDDFKPIISQEIQQNIWKHVYFLRDKKKIDILERELDFMLSQIKKNDPRGENDQQYFHIAPRTNQLQRKQVIKCKQYTQVRQKNISRVIYYQALQQIQKHKEQYNKTKLELKQVQAQGMHLVSINPLLSKYIKYNGKEMKENKKDGKMKGVADQKNVLKYMRSHHKNIFDMLETSVTNLNRSLPKDM